MQIEGMSELTPPLIDANPAKSSTHVGLTIGTSNSTPIHTTLTDVTLNRIH